MRFFLLSLGSVLFSTSFLHAAFTVTTNADSGVGSLRQAITDLNTSAMPGTITINSGLGTITLASSLPIIQQTATIQAVSTQVVDGASSFRIFATNGASLTVQNCTLQNGLALGGTGGTRDGISGCGG